MHQHEIHFTLDEARKTLPWVREQLVRIRSLLRELMESRNARCVLEVMIPLLLLITCFVLAGCVNGEKAFDRTRGREPTVQGTEDPGLLIGYLSSEQAEERVEAFHALVTRGPDTLPLMIERWGEASFYFERIVREIGGDAVEPLLQLLQSQQNTARKKAIVEAIGALGSAAAQAEPELRAQLQDPSSEVRVAACDALASIEAHEGASKAALIGALADTEPFVVLSASFALGDVAAPGDKEAISALAALLDAEPNEWLLPAVAYALHQLGWSPNTTYDLIMDEAFNRSSTGQTNAYTALAKIGDLNSIYLLGQIITDQTNGYRTVAVGQLAICGPQPEVIEILSIALRDPHAHTLLDAARVLGSFGPEARDALPALRTLREEIGRRPLPSGYALIVDEAILFISSDTD